jgi:hypothetical protein
LISDIRKYSLRKLVIFANFSINYILTVYCINIKIAGYYGKAAISSGISTVLKSLMLCFFLTASKNSFSLISIQLVIFYISCLHLSWPENFLQVHTRLLNCQSPVYILRDKDTHRGYFLHGNAVVFLPFWTTYLRQFLL